MKEKTLTHKFSLTKTGATTDKFTPFGAIMMIGSSFLYAVIQASPFSAFPNCMPAAWFSQDHTLPASWPALGYAQCAFRNNTVSFLMTAEHVMQIPAFIYHEDNSKAALWGGVVCLLTLAAYCTYQARCYPPLAMRSQSRAISCASSHQQLCH